MRISKRKIITLIFAIVSVLNCSKSKEKEFIKIIETEKLPAKDKIVLNLTDTESNTFLVSLFHSQVSSYVPKLEGNKAWIWSKEKKKLIFSVLSEELITFEEIHNEVDGTTTKLIVPKKQILYLADKENRTVSSILELDSKDIYCLNQKFKVENEKTIFQANKNYEIDFEGQKTIEIKKR